MCSCLSPCDTGTLYVVLPYFNFCKFKTRERLFIDFVKRYACTPGVQLVVVEDGRSLPVLPVFKHIRLNYKDKIWIKENMINIAVGQLPEGWRYVAWVDADITFLNKRWPQETVQMLETHDAVQMFHSAINMGPTGEVIKVDKSFGFMHAKSGTQYSKSDKYGFWHPGYGWAVRREAWDRMGGLVDWAILGSGDRHMALAFIGKVMDSAPGNIHSNYKAMLKEYQIACKGFKVSCITGTIVHHFHGSLENRKYKDRWDILTKLKFDPFEDICFKGSQLELTKEGKRFKEDILRYFQERKEDSSA